MDKETLNQLITKYQIIYAEILIASGKSFDRSHEISQQEATKLLNSIDFSDENDVIETAAKINGIIEEFQRIQLMTDSPLPDGFPTEGSFKVKKKWLKKGFLAKIKELPDNVSAGDVDKLHKVYQRAMNSEKAELKDSEREDMQVILLDLLHSHQLALPEFSYTESQKSIDKYEADLRQLWQLLENAKTPDEKERIQITMISIKKTLNSKKELHESMSDCKDYPEHFSLPTTPSRQLFAELKKVKKKNVSQEAKKLKTKALIFALCAVCIALTCIAFLT
ncbi:MAG: hypothetical protein KGV50_01065 [Gammaproteobacteria bacterium]|nr:hypothetical protein [Gammaproteobacteria bacterium]